MLVVAGLSLSNLKPRVWDEDSPYYLPDLRAVMISYADFHQAPLRRKAAMQQGLHAYLGVPAHVTIYLDNGAFYFLKRAGEMPRKDYREFVQRAKPDWRPIPQDFIPIPDMSEAEQRLCLTKTMGVNRAYRHDGYVPVIHISRLLGEYITAIKAHDRLASKPAIALGGIVPNLLRAPKAMAHSDILLGLRQVRTEFAGKQIHVFGIGGTATLHIAGLLGMDSADSSGWRNRAARGMVQLPGRGERIAADLGNWRGRRVSEQEWQELAECQCPACQLHGIDGLKASGIEGFCARATHNLWVLLEEARWVREHLNAGTYAEKYKAHLENSTYMPMVDSIVET
jgi:7-cyano-7-deazaguanine tRNA-ribosyltransferase